VNGPAGTENAVFGVRGLRMADNLVGLRRGVTRITDRGRSVPRYGFCRKGRVP
jgi:hypothetical protein